MFDCIIIGTGAAGVSAALTLKALKRDFIWIGNPKLSLKINAAEKIKNYAGLYNASGEDMRDAFLRQIEGENIAITEGRVGGVYPVGDGYSVTCGGDVYEGSTVILATGVESVKPVEGETEFLGRGVSYCAACDGFLYRDKVIAVAVEGEEELAEVELLAKYARTVYLFALRKKVSCALPNVQTRAEKFLGVTGDMRVRAVRTDAGELPVDGVFILKGSVAAASLVHGLQSEKGIVTVDRACATNLAGVFAAGDITGRPYQYAKAVGEGNVCAHSVNAYLNAKIKNG